MKNDILVVDAERRTVRVLDVALRSAGFSVRLVRDGVEALEMARQAAPDVIVANAELERLDVSDLRDHLNERPETAYVPIVVLTRRGGAEERARSRAAGAVEVLAKPVCVRELVACLDLLVIRGARARLARACAAGSGRISGSSRHLSVVDLLQAFEISGQSGVVRLAQGTQQAEVRFRDGRAVAARAGQLVGEPAVHVALGWNDATYEAELKPVTDDDEVDRSTGTLLVDGMRRIDEWRLMLEGLRSTPGLADADAARLMQEGLARLPGGRPSFSGRTPGLTADGREPTALVGSASAYASAPRGDADGESDDDESDDGDESDDEAGHADEGDAARGGDEDQEDEDEPGPVSAAREARPAPTIVSAPVVLAASRSITARMEIPAPAPPIVEVRAVPESSREQPAEVALRLVHEPVVARREAVPVVAVETESERRSAMPSSPPWTREAATPEGAAAGEDLEAAGVPRLAARTARRIVTGSVAVAAAICVIGAVRVVGFHRQHEADDARSRNVAALVAPPQHAAAAAQAAPALRDTASAASAAGELPPSPSASADLPAPEATVAPTAPAEAVAPAAPPCGAGQPCALAEPAPRGESPLDTAGPASGDSSSLVASAERALLHGDSARALTLARKAVEDTPADANAWLTLAAAHRVAGDLGAAREDYRRCTEQALTAGVNHCRILAAQ